MSYGTEDEKMPTEQQFQGLTFRDSRDYKGENFRAYLRPDTYEPRQSVFGFATWSDWIDQGRLTPVMLPFSRAVSGTLTKSGRNITGPDITDAVVSPLPPTEGSYLNGTQIMMYYWIDGMQFNTLYTLIPFNDVSLEMLIDEDLLNLRQQILVRGTGWLGRQVEKLRQEPDDYKFLVDVRSYANTYGIANALGVWVQTGRVAEPISVVTGSAVSNRTPGQNVSDKVIAAKINTDFLGLLVSGVGIFTGNPLLIGGGLVLSFIQNRNNNPSYQTVTVPTVDTTTPLQRFTERIS